MHRDLKPENILVTEKYHLKVVLDSIIQEFRLILVMQTISFLLLMKLKILNQPRKSLNMMTFMNRKLMTSQEVLLLALLSMFPQRCWKSTKHKQLLIFGHSAVRSIKCSLEMCLSKEQVTIKPSNSSSNVNLNFLLICQRNQRTLLISSCN